MLTERFRYAKIDIDIIDHPKSYLVGPEGVGLYVLSICYCVGHLTDGLIPLAAAKSLLNGAGVKHISPSYVSPLGHIGLAHPDVGWWIIRGQFIEVWNYAKKNYTRAQVEEIRKQSRSRASKYRTKISSLSRVTNSVSDAARDEFVPPSPSISDLRSDLRSPEQPSGQENPGDLNPRMGDGLVMPTVIAANDGPRTIAYVAPSPEPANFQSTPTPREQEYQTAYERGIAAGKGAPFAMPEASRGALHQALTKHARTAAGRVYRGPELLAWIEHEAGEFARWLTTKPDEIKFYSGYGPKGWLRWLNEQPAETASGGMDDYAGNASTRRLVAGIGNGGVRS